MTQTLEHKIAIDNCVEHMRRSGTQEPENYHYQTEGFKTGSIGDSGQIKGTTWLFKSGQVLMMLRVFHDIKENRFLTESGWTGYDRREEDVEQLIFGSNGKHVLTATRKLFIDYYHWGICGCQRNITDKPTPWLFVSENQITHDDSKVAEILEPYLALIKEEKAK